MVATIGARIQDAADDDLPVIFVAIIVDDGIKMRLVDAL